MLTSYKYTGKYLAVVTLLLFMPLTAICATVDFSSMLATLTKNAGPVIRLVTATAYVIGLWFIISSIQELKTIGNSQNMQAQTHGGISGPIVKFIIGIMLLYLPSTIDITVWTLWQHSAFGSEASSAMSYTPDASDPFSPIKEGAIAVVRVVGYVSFVRGLVTLSHSSSQGAQPGSFSKGIVHILGGILAINIVETIRIVCGTLGITVF